MRMQMRRWTPAVIISSRSFSPASNQICTRLLAFMNKLSKLGFGRVEGDQIISPAHWRNVILIFFFQIWYHRWKFWNYIMQFTSPVEANFGILQSRINFTLRIAEKLYKPGAIKNSRMKIAGCRLWKAVDLTPHLRRLCLWCFCFVCAVMRLWRELAAVSLIRISHCHCGVAKRRRNFSCVILIHLLQN